MGVASGRKTKSAARAVNARSRVRRALVSHSYAAGVKHLADRRREITDAGARHDDRVPSPVRFLGDTEEPSAIVFAILHVKALTLDLELFRLDDAIHFSEKRSSLGDSAPLVEANSAWSR